MGFSECIFHNKNKRGRGGEKEEEEIGRKRREIKPNMKGKENWKKKVAIL